ncbi:unnamed protein product, partial [Rotaria sp. Silwood2]
SFSSSFRVMPSAVPIQTPNAAQNLDKNELYLIGPNFWNVRGRFKILKLIDVGTQMIIIKLPEFVDSQPKSTNRFISVFVYHSTSRTLHVDDTIMYAEKSSFLLKLFGYKDDAMGFLPSIKSSGLYLTSDVPYLFRDWMRKLLHNWPFENICCAYLGVKMGEAHADVTTLLNNAEPLFAKLSEKDRKKNPRDEISPSNHSNMNVSGNECGSLYVSLVFL